LTYKVDLDLTKDMEKKGHVISMNKYITTIGLFEELALKKKLHHQHNGNKLGWLPYYIEKYSGFQECTTRHFTVEDAQITKKSSIVWKHKIPV
jgi:hypothetical protein